MNRALTMLQPISTEMNQKFQEFKENFGQLMDVESKKVERFQRYVRNTLDEQKHQKEFEEWKKKFEKMREDHSSEYANRNFDDIYGKNSLSMMQRKRKKGEDSEKGEEEQEDCASEDNDDVVIVVDEPSSAESVDDDDDDEIEVINEEEPEWKRKKQQQDDDDFDNENLVK